MRVNSKKLMVSLILGCIVVLMFGGLAHAQENWIYWLDNPWYQYGHDITNDLVVSPSNKTVFLTGEASRGSSTTYWVTIAIDVATHDTIWKYLYAPDPTDWNGGGYEIIYGPDDYLYVAGYYKGSSSYPDEGSFTIIKLDTLGNLVASDQYDLHWTDGLDKALTVAYGPDNMIYVGGYATIWDDPPYLQRYFLVRKYNTSLVYQGQEFEYEWLGPSVCTKVVVAPDNTVWAGGTIDWDEDEEMEFAVFKLNSNLHEQHMFTYKGSSSSVDNRCQSLALPWSGSDGVYAVGYAYENSSLSNDFTIFKLKQDGTQEWKYQYDRAGKDDKGYAICTGPSGAIYAAGYSNDTSGKDYTVLSRQFGLTWSYVFDGSNNGDDCAYDVAINSAGNTIYACGYTNTAHGSRDTSDDLMVTRYTPASATPTWTYIYDGNNHGDIGKALSIGTDGNIYVGGDITATGSRTRMAAISLPDNFPPTIPELVSPIDNGYVNSFTVPFTWLASEDFETSVSGYYVGHSMDPAFATYDSVWSTDVTESIVLAVDATWYWAVKAKDSNGNLSKFSDIWSFQFDFTDPLAPNPTAPADGDFEFDSSITFTWDPVTFNREVPSPVTYVLQVDTTSGFASPMAIDTTASTTSIIELPLAEYYYYWHVKAFDAAGNDGPYCANQTFMVDITPPAIDSETVWEETAFCGPFDCNAKITDMWGIEEAILHYKLMENPAWFSDTMTEGSNDWYQGQIPVGTVDNDTIKYYYHTMDNAEYDTRVPVTGYYWFIGNSTGVVGENPELPNIFSFNIKSNLIKGKATFSLSLPRSSSVTLQIYDASGRRIATPAIGMRSAGNHTITWTPQANGVYFYSLKSQWKKETGKILFIR